MDRPEACAGNAAFLATPHYGFTLASAVVPTTKVSTVPTTRVKRRNFIECSAICVVGFVDWSRLRRGAAPFQV